MEVLQHYNTKSTQLHFYFLFTGAMTPSLKCKFRRDKNSATPAPPTSDEPQPVIPANTDSGEQHMSGVEESEDDANYQDMSEDSSEGGASQEGCMTKSVSQSLLAQSGGSSPPILPLFESINVSLFGRELGGLGWKVCRNSPDIFAMSDDSHTSTSENLNSTFDVFDDGNNAELIATAIDYETNDENLAAKDVLETEFEFEDFNFKANTIDQADKAENIISQPILVLSPTPENIATNASDSRRQSNDDDDDDCQSEVSSSSYQNQMHYFSFRQLSDPLNASLQEFSLHTNATQDSAYNTQVAGQTEQPVAQPHHAIHHCSHTLTLERRICCFCDLTLHDTDDALESPCFGSIFEASGSCAFAETYPFPSLS